MDKLIRLFTELVKGKFTGEIYIRFDRGVIVKLHQTDYHDARDYR
jgi:hypothetical protein